MMLNRFITDSIIIVRILDMERSFMVLKLKFKFLESFGIE